MSRVSFFDARTWHHIIGVSSKIVEQGVFVLDDDGLKFRSMDPSHVMMIDLMLPREAFDEYNIDGTITLGINLQELSKITKRAVKGDKLILEFERELMKVIFEGKSTRIFTLPLLDLAAERTPEPKLKFNVTARMLSDTFEEIIKDLEVIGDIVRFEADNGLSIKSWSELGEGEIILSPATGAIIDYDVSEKSAANYSIEYLRQISAISRAADVVTLKFSTNMPCRLDYEIPNGGGVTFFVAPRIE